MLWLFYIVLILTFSLSNQQNGDFPETTDWDAPITSDIAFPIRINYVLFLISSECNISCFELLFNAFIAYDNYARVPNDLLSNDAISLNESVRWNTFVKFGDNSIIEIKQNEKIEDILNCSTCLNTTYKNGTDSINNFTKIFLEDPCPYEASHWHELIISDKCWVKELRDQIPKEDNPNCPKSFRKYGIMMRSDDVKPCSATIKDNDIDFVYADDVEGPGYYDSTSAYYTSSTSSAEIILFFLATTN